MMCHVSGCLEDLKHMQNALQMFETRAVQGLKTLDERIAGLESFFFFFSHAFLRPRGTRGPCATKPTHYRVAGGQGGASAPPRGARAALARARHQGRRREATQAGRQRKRAVRRLRGAPTSALPRQ